VTRPNDRDREFAHVRSHYAWSEDEAAQHFADYREECERAAIERHRAAHPGHSYRGDDGELFEELLKVAADDPRGPELLRLHREAERDRVLTELVDSVPSQEVESDAGTSVEAVRLDDLLAIVEELRGGQ
jgi:hypothetical protein